MLWFNYLKLYYLKYKDSKFIANNDSLFNQLYAQIKHYKN